MTTRPTSTNNNRTVSGGSGGHRQPPTNSTRRGTSTRPVTESESESESVSDETDESDITDTDERPQRNNTNRSSNTINRQQQLPTKSTNSRPTTTTSTTAKRPSQPVFDSDDDDDDDDRADDTQLMMDAHIVRPTRARTQYETSRDEQRASKATPSAASAADLLQQTRQMMKLNLPIAQPTPPDLSTISDNADPNALVCVAIPCTLQPIRTTPSVFYQGTTTSTSSTPIPHHPSLGRALVSVSQELAFNEMVPLAYLTFRNYYVSHLTIKQMVVKPVLNDRDGRTKQVWTTILNRFTLMNDPHSEGEAQKQVTIAIEQFNSNYQPSHAHRFRLDYYQSSPNWRNYFLNDLQGWKVITHSQHTHRLTGRTKSSPETSFNNSRSSTTNNSSTITVDQLLSAFTNTTPISDPLPTSSRTTGDRGLSSNMALERIQSKVMEIASTMIADGNGQLQ